MPEAEAGVRGSGPGRDALLQPVRAVLLAAARGALAADGRDAASSPRGTRLPGRPAHHGGSAGRRTLSAFNSRRSASKGALVVAAGCFGTGGKHGRPWNNPLNGQRLQKRLRRRKIAPRPTPYPPSPCPPSPSFWNVSGHACQKAKIFATITARGASKVWFLAGPAG